MTAIRDGVSELVEPDRAALRLAPGKVAAIFLGMLFTGPAPTNPGHRQIASAAFNLRHVRGDEVQPETQVGIGAPTTLNPSY
jgi:hypothetical protein